jgi:hypothetical protein
MHISTFTDGADKDQSSTERISRLTQPKQTRNGGGEDAGTRNESSIEPQSDSAKNGAPSNQKNNLAHTDAAASGPLALRVEKLVNDAEIIVVEHLESALNGLGRLFMVGAFEKRWKEVLNGNLNKHPVFGKVLDDERAKKHRRRYVEAVLAGAVAIEWEEKGLEFPSLSYSHRLELAKIKDEHKRLEYAEKAEKHQLSVRDLQDEIRALMKPIVSEDSVRGQKLMRQITEFVDFMKDEHNRALIQDKTRFKAAIKRGERLKMLDHCDEAGTLAANSADFFKLLGNIIVETVTEGRGTERDEIEECPEEN